MKPNRFIININLRDGLMLVISGNCTDQVNANYKPFSQYKLNKLNKYKFNITSTGMTTRTAKPKAMFDSLKVFTSKKGQFIFGKKDCKAFVVKCSGAKLPW